MLVLAVKSTKAMMLNFLFRAMKSVDMQIPRISYTMDSQQLIGEWL